MKIVLYYKHTAAMHCVIAASNVKQMSKRAGFTKKMIVFLECGFFLWDSPLHASYISFFIEFHVK